MNLELDFPANFWEDALFFLFILIYSLFCLYFPFPFPLTQNSGFSLIIGSALGFHFGLIGPIYTSRY